MVSSTLAKEKNPEAKRLGGVLFISLQNRRKKKPDLIFSVLLQIQKIQEVKRTNWVMLEGKTLWK